MIERQERGAVRGGELADEREGGGAQPLQPGAGDAAARIEGDGDVDGLAGKGTERGPSARRRCR